MTSITLDIPAGKQPQQYHDLLSTLIAHHELEELEDLMLGLHVSKNNTTDVFSSQEFITKYAGYCS